MEFKTLGVIALASAIALSGQVMGQVTDVKKLPKSVRLGEEYKKIERFWDFRRKLMDDGWTAEANPDCHDTVLGDLYNESCRDDPNDIMCRVCTMVPEIFRMTSDGYMLMRYTKDGVTLGVTLYGDVNDLDEPGRYGLGIVGWDYNNGINVILAE